MSQPTLYMLALSHPAHTARLMLEHKSIPFERKDLLAGFHPPLVRLAGFSGATVPALKIDRRKIQGTLAISRALDEIQPEPPLFPAEAERRRAVEEAERWGENVLQPIPRRLIRQLLTRSADLRRFLATDAGMPAPSVAGAGFIPLAHVFARMSDASVERVRADIRELPQTIKHVDDLIAQGTIGGEQPNAADFQIATTLRSLLAYPQLAPTLIGRPAEDLARRYMPDFPDFPPAIPPEWLPAAQAAPAAA